MFKGSNAARAKQLAAKRKKPKFALGQVVEDPYGDIGAIDAAFADLQSAEEAGIVDDADAWLKGLEKKPKTPRTGVWYSIVFGDGAGLCGELDLRPARKK